MIRNSFPRTTPSLLAIALFVGAAAVYADVTPAPQYPGDNNTVANSPEEHGYAIEQHKKTAEYHHGMVAHHKSMAAEHKKLGHKKLAKQHEAFAKHHQSLAKEHETAAKIHDEFITKGK